MTPIRTCRLVTLGCKVNQYETQFVKEALEANGYREAAEGEPADLCVVNTCTVTMEGDAKSRQRAGAAGEAEKTRRRDGGDEAQDEDDWGHVGGEARCVFADPSTTARPGAMRASARRAPRDRNGGCRRSRDDMEARDGSTRHRNA